MKGASFHRAVARANRAFADSRSSSAPLVGAALGALIWRCLLASAEAFDIDVRLDKPIVGGAPHWCFPDDGVFCCEHAPPR